jgi:hypothetical protein
MPSYVVTNPATGQKLRLTGDSPPSDDELDEIFGSMPDNAPAQYQDPASDIPQIGASGTPLPLPPESPAEFEARKAAVNEPTLFDKVKGVGEAALTLGTGATTGLFGTMAGAISGIGKSMLNGTYGTQAGADAAEQEAQSTGANLTYEPRTQVGKDMVGYIGEKAAPLVALSPFTQELSIIGQSAKAAIGPKVSAMKRAEPAKIERAPEPTRIEQAAVEPLQADLTKNLTSSFADAGMKNRIDEITKNVNVDPGKVAAAKRLGIESPIATLSNDRSLQEIAGALASSPGSKAAAQLSDYHGQLTAKAQQLIKDAGGDIDKGLVSNELKDSMDANIKLLKNQSSNIYKEIESAVPADTIVNAKPLIRELNSRANKSQNGIDGLSQVEQSVYSTLQGRPTYFDLDNLRRSIGSAISKETKAYENTSSAQLKDMYSKITDLQSGVADQVGAGAGKLWDQAKTLDKSRFELQENSQFLFGKDLQGSVMPKVEQGLKQLAKGNSKTFNEVLDTVPPAMRQKVLMSGLDTVLSKTAQGESSLSPVQFNNWYGDLSKSATNKKLLHSNLPEGAGQRLDDLFKLSQGLQNVTSKVVRTGIVHDAFKNFDANGGLVDKLYNTAEKVAKVPIVGNAVGAPAIRIGSSILKMAQAEKTPAIQAADDLLSSPEFRTAVLDYQKSGKAVSSAQQKLKATTQLKNYFKAQDPKIAAEIIGVGLLPYLVSQEDKK